MRHEAEKYRDDTMLTTPLRHCLARSVKPQRVGVGRTLKAAPGISEMESKKSTGTIFGFRHVSEIFIHVARSLLILQLRILFPLNIPRPVFILQWLPLAKH